MKATETIKRLYFSRSRKIQILNELKTGGMTFTNVARKHGIHPISIHKWKRDMEQEKKIQLMFTKFFLS